MWNLVKVKQKYNITIEYMTYSALMWWRYIASIYRFKGCDKIDHADVEITNIWTVVIKLMNVTAQLLMLLLVLSLIWNIHRHAVSLLNNVSKCRSTMWNVLFMSRILFASLLQVCQSLNYRAVQIINKFIACQRSIDPCV